ncbi:putative inorganic phosphate cotransporter [Anticarsia gemmatalis]|uniref:putative inorganic phosphate cotransporter n=1 Tax=Anticarsia gemmatalis TaxID=129554 RepID=UPI003F76DD81
MAGDKVVYQSVPKNEKVTEPSPHIPPKGFGVRHLQTFLLFISLTLGFTMRAQLSVLMVAMANANLESCNSIGGNSTNTTINEGIENNGTIDESCHSDKNISSWSVYRTYDWNKSTQEIITFAFFVGYTSMQLPMGLIAQKFGGKLPIMVALGVNGVLSICTPWTALIGGWVGVSASRLLQGMTQAAYYPSMHTILAKWAPLSERGRLSTYAYTGSQLGTIISFQVSGLFAGSPTLGWPASFWLFGSISLLACALLGWLGAASPHEHPRITTEELVHILEGGSADVVPKKHKTPWREILKCPAVWGQIVSHSGSAAGYLLVLTEIPLYMSGVLGVDIKRNGVYSSLPYLAMYLMALPFGYLADFASNRKLMKLVNIRRTANTIGMVVSGGFLLAFSMVNNTALAVTFLILSLGMHSGVHVGFLINQIDLAPNFAGPIMALGNMMGNLTGLLVPVVVSSIVTDVKNHRQWQIVFCIFVALQVLTNAIFVIFAKGEVQPWNFYGEEEEGKELALIEEKNVAKEKEMSQKEENNLETQNL